MESVLLGQYAEPRVFLRRKLSTKIELNQSEAFSSQLVFVFILNYLPRTLCNMGARGVSVNSVRP